VKNNSSDNNVKVNIPYDNKYIGLNIPYKNYLKIDEENNKYKAINEGQIIINALNNPIGSEKLFVLAKNKNKAVILVSDITRPCPSYKFLPFLVDELEQASVKEIKIIFGLGIHRKHTEEEKKNLVGEKIYNKYKLTDFEESECKLIGKTKRGTPVEVFEEVLNSDLVIATGNLEYHYFAGYSGGAKALMPGICSRNTISANHTLMLDDNSIAGVFNDNPLRQDIEEVGKIVGIDFIYNVILDDHKNIIAAFSGKNNDAFIEGIKLYDQIYKKEVKEKADIVITSPGGFPKDINLYQAQKALDNVKEIVKTGGEIILVASCMEGFGENKFEEWMMHARDYQKLYKRIKEKFVLGGHKALAISKIMTKSDISIFSDFDKNMTEKIGFKKVYDLQGHIDERLRQNSKLKIRIVENGRLIKFSGN
jgi:lactate racemase